MKRSEIIIKGCQIKSLKVARKLARQLDRMEKAIGICSVKITFEGFFICPEITDQDLDTLNKTPAETLVRDIIRQIRK